MTDHETCAGARLFAASGARSSGRMIPNIFTDIETADPRSIAYRLALVAGGLFDGVVSLNGKSDWDLAAADLLVTEAGGAVTKTSG